jgi:hypothetical protein
VVNAFRVAAVVVATALVAQAVSAVAPRGGDEPTKTGAKAKAFAPKDGGFSVEFPAKPDAKEQKLDLPDGGTATLKCFLLEPDGKDQALMVAYVDVPDDATETQTEDEFLDNAVKGFAGGVGAEEPTSKRVMLNGHLGREFECRFDDKGVIRGRIYLANGRLYQVIAAGSEDFLAGDTATKFFKSFKLTGPAGGHKD